MLEELKRLLTPNVSLAAKLIGVSMYFIKLLQRHDERIGTLEERQLQKGEKGDKGEKGVRGEKGERGEQGIPGVPGMVGPPGQDGKYGKAGAKGKDGVSVVDSEIAADNHLVFKLSDGRIIDAGELPEIGSGPGGVFVAGNAWQITVSATAPANPEVNALWLDIS